VGGKKFNFVGLPFAGIEVAKLAQTFSATTIRQDKDFNLQLVPQMDSFSVVHLATHGAFVVGTPEQSFILFGDGTPVILNPLMLPDNREG
jgi:CHAT domain-containing protein